MKQLVATFACSCTTLNGGHDLQATQYMMGHLCLELDPNILHDGRIVPRIHFG